MLILLLRNYPDKREKKLKKNCYPRSDRVVRPSYYVPKLLSEEEKLERFAKFLLEEDLETTKFIVEDFKKAYEKDLKKAVKEILNINTLRLAGSLNLYLYEKKQLIR